MIGLDPFWFIITTIAVWRVVVFIRQDKLIEGTRDRVETYLMNQHSLVSQKLHYFMGCPWCLSVWVAFFATLGWMCTTPFTWMAVVVTWLAMSALAVVFDQLSDKL